MGQGRKPTITTLRRSIHFVTGWLKRNILLQNPLVSLPRMNTEVDIRHRRRALTATEFSSLVISARDSGVKNPRIQP